MLSGFRNGYTEAKLVVMLLHHSRSESTPIAVCISFWATVCKTVRPMLSVRCPVLSCLSVTLVHCAQTVGQIKMKLGTLC